MELKIDPDKEPVENLEIVATIMDLKAGSRKKSKEDKKQKKLTEFRDKGAKGMEYFMKKKYIIYLADTICKLANRDIELGQYSNKEPQNKVLIDEKSLFQKFVQVLKENNIHDVDPCIFRKTLKRIINREVIDYDGRASFYTTKTKIGKKSIYKINF